MRFDDGPHPDTGTPMALLNTILAAMASVQAITGSAVAGVCAGLALAVFAFAAGLTAR